MSVQNNKETITELPAQAEETLHTNLAYYKLFLFRFIAKSANGLIMIFLLGLTALLVLFLFSYAAAYAIGSILSSDALGFLIVGAFYILVVGIVMLFRKRWIERPLLAKLSEIYFKDEEESETNL